jgi:hypothetical protein
MHDAKQSRNCCLVLVIIIIGIEKMRIGDTQAAIVLSKSIGKSPSWECPRKERRHD